MGNSRHSYWSSLHLDHVTQPLENHKIIGSIAGPQPGEMGRVGEEGCQTSNSHFNLIYLHIANKQQMSSQGTIFFKTLCATVHFAVQAPIYRAVLRLWHQSTPFTRSRHL